MYQVFYDQYPLYDPRDESLVLREPTVHLAVGEAGEMSFVVDDDHPCAGLLTRLHGIVELRAGGLPIFKGRIRKDTRDFFLSRRIEVEGLLACLNDSVIPPFAFPDDFAADAGYQAAAQSGNVVKFFLSWLLAQHNSQVGPAQKMLLGDVTVSDPNNYISRSSSEYLNTMEAVRQKLVDPLGGYLLADYSGETTVLHYHDDLPLTNMQDVQYGENLLDLTSEIDAAETYTAILPTGADGLTIAGLPDGEISPGVFKSGLIIYSKTVEDELGGLRITRASNWSDVTEAANLRRKAMEQLTGDGVKALHTIQVKAVDLGAVEDVSRFMVGRKVRLHSAPHGFSAVYPLMELDPNILNPGDTEITLGAAVKAASDIAHANQNATMEKLNQQKVEQSKELESLTQTMTEQSTAVLSTATEIIMSALESAVKTSDYNEFKATVEAQLAIMAGEISMSFIKATEQIDNVNGDLQKQFTKLYKYIHFSGETAITIGSGDSAITLELDNETGVVFKRNGIPFGRWDGTDFYTGNIVIDVNERAQFGNFAYSPRADGSLIFGKVRG